MEKKTFLAAIGIVFFVLLGFILSARRANHDGVAPENRSPRITVVTSFYPLYFFASEIAGENADVLNITPAGVEPHDYEPTARDIAAIEGSAMLVVNGAGFEPWGKRVKENLDPARTLVVEVADALSTQTIIQSGTTVVDPHFWLHPLIAQTIVEQIAKGFMIIDPRNRTVYADNAKVLNGRLAELDATYRTVLSQCSSRDIVTAHAAFGYLAAAYGLRQVSIAGVSPDAEPSSRQLAQLVQFVKTRGIRVIFFETLESPKLSETLAKEVGATTLVLNPLEGLTEQERKQGKDYISEMLTNLENLKLALQCKP